MFQDLIRFLADENLNRHIVKGLLGLNATADVAIAQQVGLSGVDDDTLLAWAAFEQRVVLTHDVRTMTAAAIKRLERGDPMAGLILARKKLSVRSVVEDLSLIEAGSSQEEWIGVILYLPL